MTPEELLVALQIELREFIDASDWPAEQTRLVWLLDNADQIALAEWASPLFLFLRGLAEQPERVAFATSDYRGSIALVLTGDRMMAELESPARDLLDVLEEITLRPLDPFAVRELARTPLQLSLKPELVSRIYSATAGQPWLVQYLFETLVDNYQLDVADFDAALESIIARFGRLPEADRVFQEWFRRLPTGSVRLLAYLSIDDEPIGDVDLAKKAEIDPRVLRAGLRQMLELGIAFQVPSEPGKSRYGLSRIFRQWYFHHTGSGVLLELLHPKDKGAIGQRSCPSAFTLFLETDVELILAEGLASLVLRPQHSAPTRRIYQKLCTPPSGTPDAYLLDFMSSNLQTALMQDKWDPLWIDYVERARLAGIPPVFVLQLDTENPAAVNLPIELLPIGDSFLGQQAPVYREFFGSGREPCFRFVDPLISAPGNLDLLLVGSSKRMRHEGEEFAPLPRADQELEEIVSIVTARERPLGKKLGRIVLLSDGERAFDPPVEKYAPTSENFERALRGELGGPVHLLHYSGHYVAGGMDTSSGLLFESAGQGDLFDLRRLRDSLSKHQLRFVFLSACRSGQHTLHGLQFLGAAETLLSKGVPAVIGMRWPIADSEGHTLAKAFYRDLAVSLRPELALWSARREAAKKKDSVAWAAPVMLTR